LVVSGAGSGDLFVMAAGSDHGDEPAFVAAVVEIMP